MIYFAKALVRDAVTFVGAFCTIAWQNCCLYIVRYTLILYCTILARLLTAEYNVMEFTIQWAFKLYYTVGFITQ